MENEEPLSPASDGRDHKGRFGAGNKLGKGNPFARRAHKIRVALFKAIKPEDIAAAVTALVEQAKAGDRAALTELLDRTIGKAAADTALAERLDQLEALLLKMQREQERERAFQ